MDPNFKRLRYVRYADDFVIGIAGVKQEATEIKDKVATFLKNELRVELNKEKTLISHIEKDGFRFLGTQIYRKRVNANAGKPIKRNKNGVRRRSTSELQLNAPVRDLVERLKQRGFLRTKNKVTKATSYNSVLALDHEDILAFYNYKLRGILNYYSFAENYSKL